MLRSTLHSPRLAPLALAVVLVISGGAMIEAERAPAQTLQQRLAAKRAQVSTERHKEGVLSTRIADLGARISKLQGEVAALRSREARVQAELDRHQAELDEAVAELKRERNRLERLRVRLTTSIRVLSERLVDIYKSSDPDIITVVLESDGFADLLERADYMARIREYDARVVGRVRSLRNESIGLVSKLDALEERVRSARNAISAKRHELARTRGSLEGRQGALSSVRDTKRGALASVSSARHKHEGELRILEAEEMRLRGILVGGPSPGTSYPVGPIRQGGGGMIWPVNGPVVSPFGPRWGRLHAGADISAPGGTPIRAAKAGVVALASVYGGYGNYVCINHGGGLSTCYAHLSSYATSRGASVGQGQVIGSVGCTGHCYGDHLHFEVRVNGVPTNPMGYL